MIATKRHFKRFYELAAGDKLENTKPGQSVVGRVTRSDVQEFYLQTHHPLFVSCVLWLFLFFVFFVTGLNYCQR